MIDQAISSMAYFTNPFASWQPGSNENFNGLVRQFIPKKHNLSTVIDVDLKMIEDRLNYQPRKQSYFKTPHRVFHEFSNRFALRA